MKDAATSDIFLLILVLLLLLLGSGAEAHNRELPLPRGSGRGVVLSAGKNALLVGRSNLLFDNNNNNNKEQSSPPLAFFGGKEQPTSSASSNNNDNHLSSSATSRRTKPPPLTLDLVSLFAGAAPLAVAQFGTILAVLHGLAFRFADGLVARELLLLGIDEDDDNATNRRLIRRCGRRMLALGLAGYNLFWSQTTPRTALATAGTVLLLDRLARQERQPSSKQINNTAVEEPEAGSSLSQRERQRERRRQISKQRWGRFMNQCKIHTYSLLAWSGVLTQFFPLNGLVSLMLLVSGGMAVKDILAPNDVVNNIRIDQNPDIEKTTATPAVLCQSSGYNMLALTTFLLSFPIQNGHNAQQKKQIIQYLTGPFGLAWIANFYSVTCFFPYVMSSPADDGTSTTNDDDHDGKRPGIKARAATTIWRGLRKALYLTWLLANGAVAATLASSIGRQ